MTKDEIARIKDHIEIHARREPRAVHITEIMWRAVAELEQVMKLEKENAELKEKLEGAEKAQKQLTKAKEHIQNLLELLPDEVLYHDYYNRTYVEPVKQFLKEIEK